MEWKKVALATFQTADKVLDVSLGLWSNMGKKNNVFTLMLKAPSPQQYALEMVTLEQLVPKDHLVRKIDKHIDFEFIRDEVDHLYCKDNGRPPVDPVRLFKIMLLGYLFGIPSERKLVKEIEVNVAYRWFLRMGLTENVIDASTLSQNRLRRFNGTDIFERIFNNIVEQAIKKGLVGGQALYSDSTHLKANANKRKAKNEVRLVKPSVFLDNINEAVEQDRKTHGKKPLTPDNVTSTPKLALPTPIVVLCIEIKNRKASFTSTIAR